MAYTLDTAAAAGITPEAARAIVTEVAQAEQDLATRADLAALRADLEAAMLRLERRLIFAGLAGLGILFAALRFTG